MVQLQACLPFFSPPGGKDGGETCYQIWAPPEMLTPNLPLSPVHLTGWASEKKRFWSCPATVTDFLPEILRKYIQPFSELLNETRQPLQKLKTVLPQGAAQTPDLSLGSSPGRAAASRDAWPRMVLLSRCSWMGHPRGAPTSHREVTEVVSGMGWVTADSWEELPAGRGHENGQDESWLESCHHISLFC